MSDGLHAPGGVSVESAELTEPAAADVFTTAWQVNDRANVLQLAPAEPALRSAAKDRRLGRARNVLLVVQALTTVLVGAGAALRGEQLAVFGVTLWLLVDAVAVVQVRRREDLFSVDAAAGRALAAAVAVSLLGVVFGAQAPTRIALVTTGIAGAVGLVVRLLMRRTVGLRWLGLDATRTVLVVGDAESVSQTIKGWAGVDRVRIVGACLTEHDPNVRHVAGVPVLGRVEQVGDLARELDISEVVLHCSPEHSGRWLSQLQWSLEGCDVTLSLATPLTHTSAHRVRLRKVGHQMVMAVAPSRPTGFATAVKSVIDGCVAFALLVVAAPLLVACMIAIRLDSPGPALLRQERVREHGQLFTMFKLRSMCMDADATKVSLVDHNEVDGPLFKIKSGDPRVTRIGRVLRQLSLDELPQLINVVKGQMSLVGPRPALPHEVAKYDGDAVRRLAVKPGLTGLWQISGRSNLPYADMVRLDIDYVDNWTAGRDAKILLGTARAVITRDGAY